MVIYGKKYGKYGDLLEKYGKYGDLWEKCGKYGDLLENIWEIKGDLCNQCDKHQQIIPLYIFRRLVFHLSGGKNAIPRFATDA